MNNSFVLRSSTHGNSNHNFRKILSAILLFLAAGISIGYLVSIFFGNEDLSTAEKIETIPRYAPCEAIISGNMECEGRLNCCFAPGHTLAGGVLSCRPDMECE
jgi:hypothetical protein